MENRHKVIEFDADEFEKVAATPDGRIGQFTFKDIYGNTIMIQMSDDLAAHFVATCQKVFVGDERNRSAGRGSIAERKGDWDALALSYVTSFSVRPELRRSPAQVHVQLDRGMRYEQNLGLTAQDADRLAEELLAAAEQVRVHQQEREP